MVAIHKDPSLAAITLRTTSPGNPCGIEYRVKWPSLKRKSPPPHVPIHRSLLPSSAKAQTQEFSRPFFSSYVWKRPPSNQESPLQLLPTHMLPSWRAITVMGILLGNPSAVVNIRTGRSLNRTSPSPFVPTQRLPFRSEKRALTEMPSANGSNLVGVHRNSPRFVNTH